MGQRRFSEKSVTSNDYFLSFGSIYAYTYELNDDNGSNSRKYRDLIKFNSDHRMPARNGVFLAPL